MERLEQLGPEGRKTLLDELSAGLNMYYGSRNNLFPDIGDLFHKYINPDHEQKGHNMITDALKKARFKWEPTVSENVKLKRDDWYDRMIAIALVQAPVIAGALYYDAYSYPPGAQRLLCAAFIGFMIFMDYRSPKNHNIALATGELYKLVDEIHKKLKLMVKTDQKNAADSVPLLKGPVIPEVDGGGPTSPSVYLALILAVLVVLLIVIVVQMAQPDGSTLVGHLNKLTPCK